MHQHEYNAPPAQYEADSVSNTPSTDSTLDALCREAFARGEQVWHGPRGFMFVQGEEVAT